VAEKNIQFSPPTLDGVAMLQGRRGGDERSSRGSAEVLRPMAIRRRRGPPFFSRPEAAISAVAFKVCDTDICILLCPAHSQTSPKSTSSSVMLPPLPAMLRVWAPPAC